jgi:hypothetical protein
MSEIKIYCPLKLYFFPECSERDFPEIEDIDEQYVWDEAELKESHGVWLEPLRKLVDGIAADLKEGLSFTDEPEDDRYHNIKDSLEGNSLELKMEGGQAWLEANYRLKKEIAPEDIVLLKEYAAEQFILFDGLHLGGRRTVPCSGGIFGAATDAADYYSGPNFYDVEENRLLLERELPDAGSIQMNPISY